ncbi:hypothetical protein ACET3X_001456 [Alternaria dauci]|uniref:Uncharacterized protein n=1 Tax=Alternaria dauci TaxID=48095 RepID=A0ABR3UXM9_9PLEO
MGPDGTLKQGAEAVKIRERRSGKVSHVWATLCQSAFLYMIRLRVFAHRPSSSSQTPFQGPGMGSGRRLGRTLGIRGHTANLLTPAKRGWVTDSMSW